MRGQALFAPGSGGEIPGVGGGGRGHAAKKTGQLARGPEPGVFLVDELADEGEFVGGNFRFGSRGEGVGRSVAETGGAVATGGQFFPEVREKRGVEAVGAQGVVNDLLEAGEVGVFAALEKVDEALGEGAEIVAFFEQLVTLAEAGGLDGEVAEVFEMGDGLDDFFARFVEGDGGFFGVDFLPLVAGLGGGEEFAEEGLAFFIESVQEMLEIAGEGHFVGGVKRGGRFEVAFELEVGEEGVDDEGADVVGAGEFVSRDVEFTGLVEEDAENGAEGLGLRGVAISEVGEGAEIVLAGQEFAVGRFSVAPGPANFLGVVFERFGEIEMVDRANVGFVDAHPEGDGGANHGDRAGHEGVLDFRARFGAKSGVVGSGEDVVFFEEGSERFRAVLEGGVDDGGLSGRCLKFFEEVGSAFVVGERGDGEIEVGAIEGELVVVGGLDVKITADIAGDLRGGGGGEAENAGDLEFGGEAGELEVVGAKVVAPFGNAVGFVDGEEGELGLGEAGAEFLVGEAFGGDVEEFEGVAFEFLVEGEGFLGGESGIEPGRRNVLGEEGVDLVFHEGDEGGDDEGEAIEEEGGELVAERLAATGGENRKGGAVGEQGLDDGELAFAKGVVTEVGLEGLGGSHDWFGMGGGGVISEQWEN